HLKPQQTFAPNILDYDNLLCSCQLELSKGEPRHCGNAKGSWYDASLLVSPLDSTCEQQFTFTLDGYINPAGDNAASVQTIKHLALDSDKLRNMREAVIEAFIMDDDISSVEVERFITYYLLKKDNRFNAFHTTISSLTQELIKLAPS
ncbi:MAG: hypothetical protein ACI8WB_005382, partial [Phenylobacterium sp.]